jgi:hypothetical protein
MNQDTLDIKKMRYELDPILYHFGLTRNKQGAILESLLAAQIAQDFVLPPLLEQQRQKLETEGDLWNEEELKMHFLSFVFVLCDFEVPHKVKLFYERSLAGLVQNTPLSVVCDALLARPMGINTPQQPYFFLQEFKKGKKAKDDAEGQMLIAMLIAQSFNAADYPIFGCYLLGKDWYFTTLEGKNYCCSRSYDATQTEQLVQIFHILRNIKQLIVKIYSL